MPLNKSAIKNQRKDLERRKRNKILKSKIHTALIRINEALNEKNIDLINKKTSEYFSLVDKAAKRHIFKKNKSSRLKANITKRINDILSGKHQHAHKKSVKKEDLQEQKA
jgi:small subunit ribosomal protein S20